ncbi:hypothetical protein BG36_15240 [Aquamicrobium defluvii]|uniref:Uncharacterized protein n=1 Tax=Aquamicrobium defluvii TaxID=69279 RepID=A0A011U8D9_9HYPH|nr:hypothetical protein BG36_15240 [Aquamicrobium defluvii]EZQ13075.1 hypothetical protein CF98_29920 [Halopseudomonas bauzanensis]
MPLERTDLQFAEPGGVSPEGLKDLSALMAASGGRCRTGFHKAEHRIHAERMSVEQMVLRFRDAPRTGCHYRSGSRGSAGNGRQNVFEQFPCRFSVGPIFMSSGVGRFRHFATVFGLMPSSRLSYASEAWDRVVAALTACVVVALP